MTNKVNSYTQSRWDIQIPVEDQEEPDRYEITVDEEGTLEFLFEDNSPGEFNKTIVPIGDLDNLRSLQKLINTVIRSQG